MAYTASYLFLMGNVIVIYVYNILWLLRYLLIVFSSESLFVMGMAKKSFVLQRIIVNKEFVYHLYTLAINYEINKFKLTVLLFIFVNMS